MPCCSHHCLPVSKQDAPTTIAYTMSYGSKQLLLCARSFFGDVASSGPRVGPDDKPLHNPRHPRRRPGGICFFFTSPALHFYSTCVLCALGFRGLECTNTLISWQNCPFASTLMLWCWRLQYDDKYKILADVPGALHAAPWSRGGDTSPCRVSTCQPLRTCCATHVEAVMCCCRRQQGPDQRDGGALNPMYVYT